MSPACRKALRRDRARETICSYAVPCWCTSKSAVARGAGGRDASARSSTTDGTIARPSAASSSTGTSMPVAVSEDFARPEIAVGGDDRRAARHGFDDDVAEAFPARRADEQADAREKYAHGLATKPGRWTVDFERRVRASALEVLPFGPFAENHQREIRGREPMRRTRESAGRSPFDESRRPAATMNGRSTGVSSRSVACARTVVEIDRVEHGSDARADRGAKRSTSPAATPSEIATTAIGAPIAAAHRGVLQTPSETGAPLSRSIIAPVLLPSRAIHAVRASTEDRERRARREIHRLGRR